MVETRLFYFLCVNQLILSAQYKEYNQKERVGYEDFGYGYWMIEIG